MFRSKLFVIVICALTLAIGQVTIPNPTVAHAAGVSKERAWAIHKAFAARSANHAAVGGNEANCDPGTVSSAAVTDVLGTMNDLRELAGLNPVTNLAPANRYAQAAALTMAANNDLEHVIPANWKCRSEDAITGAASSNLSIGWPSGVWAAKNIAFGQWIDRDVSSLGHRRWLMMPSMSAVAIGAFSGSQADTGTIGTFAPSASTNSTPSPDGISWPPNGYVPHAFLPNGNGNWWHVSLTCELSDREVTVRGPNGIVYAGYLIKLPGSYGGWDYHAYSIPAPNVPKPAKGAEASYSFTLNSPCNSFTGFTSQVLGDAPEPVSLVTPTVKKVVGPDNDTISWASHPGVTWSDSGWVDGNRTISATAKPGYFFVGQSSWSFVDKATIVTVPSPMVSQVPGGHNDVITTTPTTGVNYTVSDWVNGYRTVTATAINADYVLSAPTVWHFYDPIVTVTAVPPSVTSVSGYSNDTINITETTGVKYSVSDWSNWTKTVTATALPGYLLAGPSVWSFRDSPPTITPPTPTVTTVIGGNNDLISVPYTYGVSYDLGVWSNGYRTVTATSEHLYILTGTTTWTFVDPPLIPGKAVPPTVTKVTGIDNDIINVPTIPGLIYSVAPWNPDQHQAEVTVTLAEGYEDYQQQHGEALPTYSYTDVSDNPIWEFAKPRILTVPGPDNDIVVPTLQDGVSLQVGNWVNGSLEVRPYVSDPNYFWVGNQYPDPVWHFSDGAQLVDVPSPIQRNVPGANNDTVILPDVPYAHFTESDWENGGKRVSFTLDPGYYPKPDDWFTSDKYADVSSYEWLLVDCNCDNPIIEVPSPTQLQVPGPNNDIILPPNVPGVVFDHTPWSSERSEWWAKTEAPYGSELTGVFRWTFTDDAPAEVSDLLPQPWPHYDWRPFVDRWSGPSAIDTAVAVSSQLPPLRHLPYGSDGFASTVVVANDVGFQDALAAVPLASKFKGRLLLTSPNELSESVIAEIRHLEPQRIVIQGGRMAISPAVEDQLRAIRFTDKAPTLFRISGASDVETAVKTADQMYEYYEEETYRVFISNNKSFQDALGAGPIAGRLGQPMLLVDPAQPLPSAVADYLQRKNVIDVTLVGGRSALPDSLAAEIQAITGFQPKRISGPSGIDTTVAVANLVADHREILLSNNVSFQDALGAGPAAARLDGTVLLTNGQCLPQSVLDLMATSRPIGIHLIGGRSAMAPALERLTPCGP